MMRTNMKKYDFQRALVLFATVTLYLVSAGVPNYAELNPPARARGQATADESEDQRPLEYKVWRIYPPDRRGFAIAVLSVNPKHFNRGDMAILAHELNSKFGDIRKVKAGLLDNADTARLFVEGLLDYPSFEKAERGRYYLDRDRCNEYIQFSRHKAKPKQTLTFNCNRDKQKQE